MHKTDTSQPGSAAMKWIGDAHRSMHYLGMYMLST
jgi:hypothetical protein